MLDFGHCCAIEEYGKIELKEINFKQDKALKEIYGKKWKKIPQVDKIKQSTFGIKVEGDSIVGLGLHERGLTTLPESIGNLSSLEECLFIYSNKKNPTL